MACTMRLASETARLGQPEVKLGLMPGYGGTQRLPRLVGQGVALKLLLTGEMIGAAEALRIGLVDEVVPAAELMARAEALARAMVADGSAGGGGVPGGGGWGRIWGWMRRWRWRQRYLGGFAGRKISGRGRGRFWRSERRFGRVDKSGWGIWFWLEWWAWYAGYGRIFGMYAKDGFGRRYLLLFPVLLISSVYRCVRTAAPTTAEAQAIAAQERQEEMVDAAADGADSTSFEDAVYGGEEPEALGKPIYDGAGWDGNAACGLG